MRRNGNFMVSDIPMQYSLIERPGAALAPLAVFLGLLTVNSATGPSGRWTIYLVLLLAYCVFRVGQRGTCLLRARIAGHSLPINDMLDWFVGMVGAFTGALLFYVIAIRTCGNTSLSFVMTQPVFWVASCVVGGLDTWFARIYDQVNENTFSFSIASTATVSTDSGQSGRNGWSARPTNWTCHRGTDLAPRSTSAHATGSYQNCVICQSAADALTECRECGARHHAKCRSGRLCPVCGNSPSRTSVSLTSQRRAADLLPRSGSGHTVAA